METNKINIQAKQQTNIFLSINLCLDGNIFRNTIRKNTSILRNITTSTYVKCIFKNNTINSR